MSTRVCWQVAPTKLRIETWCFGDNYVDDAESTARRNFKTHFEIAALTFDNIRHDFADSFRLDRAHRTRAVFGVSNRPVHEAARHADARVHQITPTRPHLKALEQFSAW